MEIMYRVAQKVVTMKNKSLNRIKNRQLGHISHKF